MDSSITLATPEEALRLGVSARLQPPSISMRSCGHPPAIADKAMERSFVQLCKLSICSNTSNHVIVGSTPRTISLSHEQKSEAREITPKV